MSDQERTTIDWTRLWRQSALVLSALIVTALAIQTSALLRLPGSSVKPDLLTAVVYYFARYVGAVPGTILGFLVGLLEDVSNPGTLGVAALAKSTVGFLTGRYWAGRRIFKENRRAEAVTLFVAILLHDLIYLLFYTAGNPLEFLSLYGRVSLPTALLTALFCPALVALAGWLVKQGPRLHARILRLE
jgi:rod shape-determining protein MreD